MRLQIDIGRKTVRIDEQPILGISVGDFIRELMELQPNDWQDYKLIQSEETISWPTSPDTSQPWTSPQPQPGTNPFNDPYPNIIPGITTQPGTNPPQIFYSTDSDVVQQGYREHRIREGRDTPTDIF